MFGMVTVGSVGRGLVYGVEGVVLFLVASVFFDVVHYILHQFLKSHIGLLRRIGALHQAHHDFFNEALRFDERYARANLFQHVIPEYANQVAFTVLGYFVVGVWPVVVALAIETLIFLMVVFRMGMDEHHLSIEKRPAKRNHAAGLFVTADYHSLHHIHPDRYFSSYVTVFDRLMGTACQVVGRQRGLDGRLGSLRVGHDQTAGASGGGSDPPEARAGLLRCRRLGRRRGAPRGRHPSSLPRGEGGLGDGGQL